MLDRENLDCSDVLIDKALVSINKKETTTRTVIIKRVKVLDSKVSAPILCYFFLLLLSIVFIGISMIISNENALGNLGANIGYGVLCSTLVALLVDYGATKRQRERDKNEFSVLTYTLKNNIKTLIQIRTTFELLNPDLCSDMDFNTWATIVFVACKDNNTIFMNCGKFLIDFFKAMLLFAKDLRYKSGNLARNQFLPESFLVDLDAFIHGIEGIQNANSDQIMIYAACVVGYILDRLTRLFPEYKSVLFEKWNSKEMIQKYGPTYPKDIVDKLIELNQQSIQGQMDERQLLNLWNQLN